MAKNQKWHFYHFVMGFFFSVKVFHVFAFHSVDSFVDWANENSLNEEPTLLVAMVTLNGN